MKQQVNLEIMQFVETQILPKYTEFGESHGLRHVTRVIKNALKLVPVTGADIDMVYIVAAYHDLGMSGPRAIHHLTSGKILQADARLKRWFTPEQIKIMRITAPPPVASPEASMARLLPKPTATSMFTKSFFVPSNTERRTIPEKKRKSNGSGSPTTWTRNIPATATSSSGFPTHPMRRL